MIFVCVFGFRILAATKVNGHMAEEEKRVRVADISFSNVCCVLSNRS